MAASTTIRVREETRRALARMAERQGRTIPDVVAELVERVETDAMFAEHHAALTRAAEDPALSQDQEAEERLWDRTLMDGLADDPWPVDGHGEPRR